MSKFFLSAAEAARAMAVDPQVLRSQAKSDPEALGFPVAVIGHRIHIPRIPFARFIGISDEDLQVLLSKDSSIQEAVNV